MSILPKSPDQRTILKIGLVSALSQVIAPAIAAT